MLKVKEKSLHTFISDIVKPDSVVIDLGANKGEFSRYMIDNFNVNVYAIEPVPELFHSIPQEPRLKKFQCCISAENKACELKLYKSQCASMYSGANSSSNEKTIMVEGITLENFLERNKIERVALLKVDIEGAEIEMLENLDKETLDKISQISVEFHDFLWPELKPRVENIKRSLAENGFYCVRFTFHNNGNVLFVRQRLVSKFDYLYLKYFLKYIKKLANL